MPRHVRAAVPAATQHTTQHTTHTTQHPQQHPRTPAFPQASYPSTSSDDEQQDAGGGVWHAVFSRKRAAGGVIADVPLLDNLGNTCYLNSVLQALLCVGPLTEYFRRSARLAAFRQRNQRLCVALASLLTETANSAGSCVEMTAFKQAVESAIPAFRGNDQQDAHEFLTFFLDGIHEELNSAPERSEKIVEPDLDGNLLKKDPRQRIAQAASAWSRYIRRNQSVIVDLFHGQSMTIVECLECHHASASFGAFMYLPLTPPGTTATLESVLEQWLSPEQMPDAEWNCSKCKRRVGVQKSSELVVVPPVLIVQLKRFDFDGYTLRKIGGLCRAPRTEFDLSEFVPGAAPRSLLYTLSAVIDHSGDPQSGHYTAFVRQSNNDSRWVFTDDTLVRTAAEKDVINRDNYLLLYTRTPKLVRVRQRADRPASWPHRAYDA